MIDNHKNSLDISRKQEPLTDVQWPIAQYPTPYEIFGINSQLGNHLSKRELRDLKKKYHKYVKLYHPDLSITRDILDATRKGQILSLDEKINRFKMISQAYDILTNINKKRVYDLNRSNWSHGGPSTMDNLNDLYQSRNFNSDDASMYWHAGTWEEMNEFNRRQQDQNEKDFAQQKYVIYWAIGMLICIEGSVVLTKVENSLVGRIDYGITEDDVEKGLFRSYHNYGLDDDKLSRIKRFLWFRSWGLYTTSDELDREAKNNESLINTISDPNTGELIKKAKTPKEMVTANTPTASTELELQDSNQ
ncbi:J domain-containing protein 1 [Maudiozyma exigua]|uniref:J domain-containing protein 1 n=1 Tax=Maudiozyma exigua TaxID=34358 RepID=A0A9P6W1S3_MAUEX|nr:J domain-containing protein 1 [Kazachstania exigua]